MMEYNMNKCSDNLIEVYKFAEKAHRGKVRKYTGERYINHPFEVMLILQDYGWTSDSMLSAALLHDVVEDTDITLTDIEDKFGRGVRDLVFDLTDISQKWNGNRAKRKAIDRQHLADGSSRAQLIKCADLISNTKSIVEHDPSFAKVYLVEKKMLLGVMRQRVKETSIYEEALRLANEGEGDVT